MVIDFQEYVAKRNLEKALIQAEEAKQNLADAYASKGLREVFAQRGYEWTDEDTEKFRPLMIEAIELGLPGAEIEAIIISLIEDPDEEEVDE